MSAIPADPTAFGLTLQLLRLGQELSINGLGKLAGVDPAYLWRLERGEKTDPSLSVLRKICFGLGIAPQEFLTRLVAVESAVERGIAVELPTIDGHDGDADHTIFSGLLTERRQKQAIRDATSHGWNQVTLADTGRVGRVLEVPILGRIAAGKPLHLDTEEVREHLKTTAAGLPKDPGLFALEVDGLSMIGAGIDSGSRVVVSPKLASTMQGGQVGACRLYGSEVTLKHVWRTDDGYLLRANNPAFPDLALPLEACEVLGVVVRVVG